MGLELGEGGALWKTLPIISPQTGAGDSLSPRTLCRPGDIIRAAAGSGRGWKIALGASPACGGQEFVPAVMCDVNQS